MADQEPMDNLDHLVTGTSVTGGHCRFVAGILFHLDESVVSDHMGRNSIDAGNAQLAFHVKH